MDLTTFNSDVATTMTSREIAELCEKRHDHVMVDVEKLFDFYKETYSPEKSGQLIHLDSYKDNSGKSNKQYLLNKDAVIDLITGYSLPHRHAVNQRWQELEAAQLPKNRIEALRQLADSLEREDALKTEVNGLMIKLDAHADYATVKKMEAIFSRKFNWRPLKAKSIELGFKLYKAEDANYESGVNVYHKDVWKSVYDIDIKQHLRMKDGKPI